MTQLGCQRRLDRVRPDANLHQLSFIAHTAATVTTTNLGGWGTSHRAQRA